MKTITIRDLRLRWPETERTLQVEKEVVITRDGQPVARLMRIVRDKPKRKRWDPEAHKRWLRKIWGNKQVRLVDKYLQSDRDDRRFSGPK